MSRLRQLISKLKHRRVFRALALYAIAAWIVVEVSATTLPYLLLPEWTVTLVIVLAIVGFPITIVLAWAFDVTPRGILRTQAAPRGEGEEAEAERGEAARSRWRLLPASFASMAVLIAAAGLFLLLLHPASGESFKGRDWILIADFDNETGDETFDRTLAEALRTSVRQSRFVNVVDPSRVAEALGQIAEEPRERTAQETALELAVRVGAKAVLLGSIRPEEQGFAISAQILDPTSGKPMRRTLSVVASQRETVLVALDVLAERIRRALGEPREEIETSAVEIPVATTSSLQALKNWVEGKRAWAEGRYDEAGRLFMLAVEQDSSFAMAHSALGGYYYFGGSDRPKGDEHFAIALGLRDRLTERERILIEASVHAWRGNFDEAITIRRVYLRKYPDDAVQWYNLGTNFMNHGRCDEAFPALERALEIDTQFVNAYVNTATCHRIVGDFASAVESYGKAFEFRPRYRTDVSLNHQYGGVLLQAGDLEAARSHFELMLPLDSERKARGHRSLGLLATYLGKYEEAAEHFKEAVQYTQVIGWDLSEYRDRLFLVSVYWAIADTVAFRRELDAVWDLQSRVHVTPFFLSVSGQLYVWDNQLDRAHRNLGLILERASEGNRGDAAAENLVQGEILISEGDLLGAIEVLSLASKQEDDAFRLEPLARAQRLAGNLEDAKASYTRIVERPSFGWEGDQRWLYAHYWLGGVHEESGDHEDAARWYRTLLELWSEGDMELPLRQDAERRLAQLRQR